MSNGALLCVVEFQEVEESQLLVRLWHQTTQEEGVLLNGSCCTSALPLSDRYRSLLREAFKSALEMAVGSVIGRALRF